MWSAARERGLQEAEYVELVNIFDTGVGECEDGPGELEECNIQRSVDLFFSLSVQSTAWALLATYPRKEQIRGDLPKDICRAPDCGGVVELLPV